MKATAVLAVSIAFTVPALAAGPFDGVYQYGLSPSYFSVHQNGSTLIVASLGSVSATGVGFSIGPYVVHPATVDYWSYSIGAISGNTAQLTGIGVWGACSSTNNVTFDGAGNASVTFVSASNTILGTQQGVDCTSLYQSILATVGPTITLRRIF